MSNPTHDRAARRYLLRRAIWLRCATWCAVITAWLLLTLCGLAVSAAAMAGMLRTLRTWGGV